MTNLLFVVTAADHWTLADESSHPTGYWAEEVAEPHRIFSDAGWEITIATPAGKRPTLDRLSLGIAGGLKGKRRRIEEYLGSISPQLDHPVPLDQVDEAEYDLVFYPGGHGPMEDLAYDHISGALLRRRLSSGRALALLCHGPAAIVAAANPDGSSPFAGYRMTALSNREEGFNRFARKAKWLLEDKLVELGVDYVKGLVPLRPFITEDRNVFTGQNPQSADALANRLVAVLGGPANAEG